MNRPGHDRGFRRANPNVPMRSTQNCGAATHNKRNTRHQPNAGQASNSNRLRSSFVCDLSTHSSVGRRPSGSTQDVTQRRMLEITKLVKFGKFMSDPWPGILAIHQHSGSELPPAAGSGAFVVRTQQLPSEEPRGHKQWAGLFGFEETTVAPPTRTNQ